jgi:hypothetical protein
MGISEIFYITLYLYTHIPKHLNNNYRNFMKIIITLFLLALLTISCSKKEEVKFEAFSPEAFAYDIGDSWEINSTVNVRGFVKNEVGDELSTSLDFSVDIIDPDGVETKNIFLDSKEVTSKELIDVQLEAQFELDYNTPDGQYKIIFNITDKYSGEIVTAEAEFTLRK